MLRFLRHFLAIVSFTLLVSLFAFDGFACGQSVWSGFSYSFEKFDFANPALPANQDRITDNVWLTRGNSGGLYNIQSESGYSVPPPVGQGSPVGTQWATALNNPTKTIAATNWTNLTFTDWVSAYGGQGTMNLPNQLLANNAVVYLVADNTYLDLRFTTWHGAGGGFAYERAAAPPPLTTGDYNLNGVIDAADYVVWRNTLTQTASPLGSGADGNANGTIDSGDFDFWRARFGNVLAGSATGTFLAAESVPEPTMCALLLSAVVALNAVARISR
jgi:hypothetical protein